MSGSRRLIALVTIGLLPVIGGCGEQSAVTGTALYRERMALPPGAVLEVVLEDISRADAPAVAVVRETRVRPGQPPYTFELRFDHGAIDPDHTYAVRARITAGDELLFVTDRIDPVLTRGYGSHVELLLVRATGATATGVGAMRGMVRYLADAALFTDCATARRLPMAMAEDFRALERAYLATRGEPGGAVLATFTGRIENRPAMEGDDLVETVVVEAFEGVWPGETCGNPGAVEALENTYWKLTRLGGAPVRVLDDRTEPHLVLRPAAGRIVGSGGCNRFSGAYELDGKSLVFTGLAGTMMACREAMEQEGAFLEALGAVAGWRIEGQHLELLAAGGEPLLRLEARALP